MGGRYSDSTAILEISFPIYCSTEATIHPKSSFQPFDLFLHELCIAESASSPFVISCSNGQWCCPGQFDLFVWWKISQSCNVHFLPISLPHLFQSPSFSLFMPLPFQLLDRASCLTLIFHCLPLFLRRACYNSAPSTSFHKIYFICTFDQVLCISFLGADRLRFSLNFSHSFCVLYVLQSYQFEWGDGGNVTPARRYILLFINFWKPLNP